ncbi:MAG: MBL fold metallo-hydrolase [Phycicoccus sp.]
MIESLSVVERPGDGWDPRIRSFRASDLVDLYTVVTGTTVLLFDTGNAPEQAHTVMRSVEADLASRRLLIVVSHHHFDHSWGNALFARGAPYEAPIVAHRQAVELTTDADNAAQLDEMRATRPYLSSVWLVPPTVTFATDHVIDGGDLTFRLLHTPGHCPDHLVAWIPEIRTVLAGDAVDNFFPLISPGGSIAGLERDLGLIAGLDPLVILPSHSGTADRETIDRNLWYLQSLSTRVADRPDVVSVPPDHAPAAIDWTFDDVLHQLGLSRDEVPEMYRDFHAANVARTAASLPG